jgi:Fur family transcriptional regulator, zinc uptake regulator
MVRPSSLPAPAEELVLGALRRSKKPLSAYDILEKVEKFGIKSSPIVYRALEVLMKNGSAHKINELGAFVACDCTADHHHDVSVLTVCKGCKRVDELHDHAVIHHLTNLRKLHVNLIKSAVVELPITCQNCAGSA